MTTCRAAIAGLIMVATLEALAPAVALADPEEDQAAARALFNEARALVKAGRFEPACPKLEAAARLYRGPGVLLNLADCLEHVGRKASAWSTFGEAASVAARAGLGEDEAEARRRLASLEPHLPKLVVHASEAAPGLTLLRDGKELLTAAWDTPIPVDAGRHTIDAAAPGYAPWSLTVEVAAEGATEVDVPRLTLLPPPAPLPAPPALPVEPPRYWTARRVAGASVTAVGVVGLGIAGAVGLAASAEFTRANGETGAARVHDSGVAVTTGDAATVVAVVGLAAAATGAIVWLTGRTPAAPASLALSPFGVAGAF